jgi:hypothetical protein
MSRTFFIEKRCKITQKIPHEQYSEAKSLKMGISLFPLARVKKKQYLCTVFDEITKFPHAL